MLHKNLKLIKVATKFQGNIAKKYDVAYIHHHDQKIYFSVKKCCLNSILKSIFWPWYMLLWTPDVFSKKIKIFFDFEGPKIDVAAAINLALAKLLLNRRHSISKENWSNLITSRLLCTAFKDHFLFSKVNHQPLVFSWSSNNQDINSLYLQRWWLFLKNETSTLIFCYF